MTSQTSRTVLFALLAGTLLLAAAPAIAQDAPDPGDGEIAVVLEPQVGGDQAGEGQQYNVTVVGPDAGVANYNFNVSVGDTAVAEISNFTLTRTGDFSGSEITADNSTLVLSESLQDEAFENASEVTLATVTVSPTDSAGTTSVTLDGVDDESITDSSTEMAYYTVQEVQNATFPDSSAPPPVVGESPPQDIDGDGLYEDVRGNGEVGVFDVQTLFSNLDGDVLTSYPEAFNFQGDSPGEVTVFDVQALFDEV